MKLDKENRKRLKANEGQSNFDKFVHREKTIATINDEHEFNIIIIYNLKSNSSIARCNTSFITKKEEGRKKKCAIKRRLHQQA